MRHSSPAALSLAIAFVSDVYRRSRPPTLLSDTLEPDSGNFTIFPGSHLRPFPERNDPPLSPQTPGAVQLTGKAGDCILFPHSLWHGPSDNHSGKARKTLLYNYCQMFMRSYDF